MHGLFVFGREWHNTLLAMSYYANGSNSCSPASDENCLEKQALTPSVWLLLTLCGFGWLCGIAAAG